MKLNIIKGDVQIGLTLCPQKNQKPADSMIYSILNF